MQNEAGIDREAGTDLKRGPTASTLDRDDALLASRAAGDRRLQACEGIESPPSTAVAVCVARSAGRAALIDHADHLASKRSRNCARG
jgi:hypothetical protein